MEEVFGEEECEDEEEEDVWDVHRCRSLFLSFILESFIQKFRVAQSF